MISGKCGVAVIALMSVLLIRNPIDAVPDCPFVDPVAPLSAKDSTSDSCAFVSLAWVTRDFSVTVRSTDSMDTCIFNLDKQRSGKGTIQTGLYSFKPGHYRVSFQRHHDPGSHSSLEWADTVIELKAGTWYIARFGETSIERGGKSLMRNARAKAWRLELTSTLKVKVIKHASGERPAIKSVVLAGTLLMALLFGGIMLYAR